MKTLELHQGHLLHLEKTLKAQEWRPHMLSIMERLRSCGLKGQELQTAIEGERDTALELLGVSKGDYFTMINILRHISQCDEVHLRVPEGFDMSILDAYYPNGLPCELKVTYCDTVTL